ncbi:hypothetical protein FHL15_009541 [Xylaria flabelliformis]|uniref:RING-type domain-containing protein n=1 Tax=Xylaria flabelliformis TaxID=2512241 RepID=A0A553HNV2_9PEZI|nr:hypothetical protein FHL15_009541 [Xylaria flabelliformis]
MATWGGSSRALPSRLGDWEAKTTALCRHALLLDGRLAPNNNSSSSNNHNHSNSNNTNTDVTSLAYVNTNTNTDTNANANAYVNADADTVATGPGTLDHYLFGGIEVPDVHPDISLANDTVSSRYADSPLPSPSDNDSLFATVGDTLSNPFHTTPNVTNNFPLLHVSGALNSTLCTASRELPRPIQYPLSLVIPPTPTPTSISTQAQLQPQTQFQTLTSALAYQPHYSNFGFPEQLNIPSADYSGGYHQYTPSQNYQFGSPPAVQGSPYFHPYFNTTPTLLSQPHMSHTNIWSNPSLSQAQQPPTSTGVARSIDDPYLVTLATQDFSSPSLPPLSHPASPTTLSLSPRRQSKLLAAGQEMPPSTRRRIANRGGAVDLTKEEPDLNSGIDSSIPLVTMPAATRRRSLASADPSSRKRRPSAVTSPSSRPNKTRRKEPPINGDSCPFSDDDPPGLDGLGLDGSETIDLSNATEVPVELLAPKVDNRVKIGNFQCVICMDDTTALTVTHCGHLFCSECLHSSLHIDSMKRTCPVCRAKVDLKDKNRKAVKSYFHLELKVMTATKKGKRPVGT